MKCEFCSKENKPGKSLAWDMNFIKKERKIDEIIPREDMDLYYFCDINCLKDWQVKQGVYNEAKKKAIERSGSDPTDVLEENTGDLKTGFRYRRSKNKS